MEWRRETGQTIYERRRSAHGGVADDDTINFAVLDDVGNVLELRLVEVRCDFEQQLRSTCGEFRRNELVARLRYPR